MGFGEFLILTLFGAIVAAVAIPAAKKRAVERLRASYGAALDSLAGHAADDRARARCLHAGRAYYEKAMNLTAADVEVRVARDIESRGQERKRP
ncbi:MAG TPA: hypothetical protein VGL86_26715 [Polyangia bacterium]|jgi:hypothetical protein